MSRSEQFGEGADDGRRGERVVSERVARAAARVLLAAEAKQGVESSPKTKRLAARR